MAAVSFAWDGCNMFVDKYTSSAYLIFILKSEAYFILGANAETRGCHMLLSGVNGAQVSQ